MDRIVLVVDDESFVRTMVGETLASRGFEIETAENAKEALAILQDVEVDLALVDLDLGEVVSGVDLVHVIQSKYPEVFVVVLTNFPDVVTASVADGSLPPDIPVIQKSSVGDSDVFFDSLLDLSRIPKGVSIDPENSQLAGLSIRQLVTLRMLAQGYNVPEIAKLRDRSVSAIEKQIGEIYRVLGIDKHDQLNRRTEAVRLYSATFGLPSRPTNQCGADEAPPHQD